MEKLNLEKIREHIDRIDGELAKLFEERMEIVQEVAAYKKANNLPVRDLAREQLVLGNCKRRVQKADNAQGLQAVMEKVMEAAVRSEEKILEDTSNKEQSIALAVGYQGVPGAYSHMATEKFFAEKNTDIQNFTLFEDVVQAVVDGKIKYGVLPIENSSTGGITEVYDLIRRYNCSIVGEQSVKVEHCLLAYPGTKLEDIKEVYSHPQGFAQCRPFFRKYPKMQQLNYYNTAKAAELVANKKNNYMAAVAGAQAAERYGLEILARGINANTNNYTRFFVIAAEPRVNASADKITLVVSLKHAPGSLYRLLGCFANNNINMLNIESRPLESKSWEYFFHIDISGNLADANVKLALEEVGRDSVYYRILGNYLAARQ